MKTFKSVLAAILFTLSLTAHAAEMADATIYCWSLRFHSGEDTNPFSDAVLNLSTVNGVPNGELAPWYSTYSHSSGFVLDWTLPINGEMVLDLPPSPDANNNGFDDSYEVSQEISGTSLGEFSYPGGHGEIFATWSRAAGAKEGTCLLRLVDDDFDEIGTFRHTFEVLEYKGKIVYTPGSTIIASLELTNTSGETLRGPLSVTKEPTDPFNELALQSLFLTNSAQQVLTLYDVVPVIRDLFVNTNYYGAFEIFDGFFDTPAEDYYTWELSIDDVNDTDQDGIPNFSDTPNLNPPPRPPVLSLMVTTTNLLLSISGDLGRMHHLLETSSLADGNWLTNSSLTLTNDPQITVLPLPQGGTRFWRAIAQ